MVTLNTLYDAANGDGATPDTAPLTEATSSELLTNVAGEIGVDAEILQSTFGSKLTGLTKDQAIAMLYQLLNAIDSDDTTDEIELEGDGGEITAETFKKALVTELGIEEEQLDDALTDFNSVFKASKVTFQGQDTDDVEDDIVTTTEDTTKVGAFKLPADTAKTLFAEFGGYSFGYQPPEEGNGTNGQVVKKSGNAEEGDGDGDDDPQTTPTED